MGGIVTRRHDKEEGKLLGRYEKLKLSFVAFRHVPEKINIYG